MYLSIVAVSPRPITRATVGAAAAIVPDLLLASAFLAVWLAPALLGPAVLPAIVLALVLEFFVIQAAGFLGVAAVAPFPRALRSIIVVGLGALYMLILWSLAHVTSQGWMIWAFWALVLNRLWALAEPALALDLRSSQPLQTEWGKTGVIYTALAVITAVVPVPALGFGLEAAQPAAGVILWTNAPQHAMAFGALYYGLIAWRRVTRAVA